jgi:hypothetical protein
MCCGTVALFCVVAKLFGLLSYYAVLWPDQSDSEREEVSIAATAKEREMDRAARYTIGIYVSGNIVIPAFS